MSSGVRFLQSHGTDATITNFSKSGEDSYGDPKLTETTTDTKAVVSRSLTGSGNDRQGKETRVTAVIHVDRSLTLYDGEDGNYPSEIAVSGKDYEVQMLDPQGDLYAAHCRRI